MTAKNSARSLIFIHGHGFKPQYEEFYNGSLDALRSRLARDHAERLESFDQVRKEFIYFGDLTHQLLTSLGLNYDESRDVEDRRSALVSLQSLIKPKMFSLSNYDRLPGKSALKEFAADVGSPLLRTLGLSQQATARLSPDLGEYWSHNSDYHNAVQSRVHSALRKASENGEDILLIAHGVGSIYAYDALWALSHDTAAAVNHAPQAKIHTWLTLGSPLSDGMVQTLLTDASVEPQQRYPRNIERWHNLAAEDDFLCHDKTMKDDFKAMLELGLIRQIKDYRIYNLAVRHGKSQPQSSIGYLAHPRTASLVAHWLGSQ